MTGLLNPALIHQVDIAIGRDLDDIAEQFGVAPRDVVFEDGETSPVPDDAFRRRIRHYLFGLPARG